MSYTSQNVNLENARRFNQGNGEYSAVPSSTAESITSNAFIGQWLDGLYYRLRVYFDFALPSGFMALDATLHLYINSIKAGGHSFNFEVRRSTASVPPANGQQGYYGSVLTSVASSSLTAGAWNSFTVSGSYLSSITKIALTTDREVAGTAPTGDEYADVRINKTGYVGYLTVQVPLSSQAPTDLSLIPVGDASNVIVSAKYHKAGSNGNTLGKYARIEVASDSGFTTILKDTGQITLDTPLNDGETLNYILDWFPSSEQTYYYRVAFWDEDNKNLSAVWGSSNFTVGYPVINSVNISNDKDKYTFQAVITDSYSKPPVITLTIGKNTELMDFVSRTGTSPYTYTFSKTVSLEKGDYEYHIEVGNVWTVLIDDTRYLHVDYTFNDIPEITLYSGNTKINAWNISLTEQTIPDFCELDFITDTDLNVRQITAKLKTDSLKTYIFEIDKADKVKEGFHITATEKAKSDFKNAVSFSTQAITSIDLVKNLLKTYQVKGYELPESVYLQSFENEEIGNLINKLLILNNALGYARNRTLYLYDSSDTNYKYKLSKYDAQVEYSSEPGAVINKVREYYLTKLYPVPISAFTNYDASNWTGTVSNETMTSDGLVSPSGNYYILKGNGTIYRSCSFKFTDFDNIVLNWCPKTATTLEIRLETDASNYKKYTRTFAGSKGSGFVLTGSSPDSEVYKEITFSDKKIHYIDISVSYPCKYKIELKLDGSVVSSTDYMIITDNKRIYCSNITCDTIRIYFTNLYVIGTAFGVSCTKLEIEEYTQSYQITSTSEQATWHNRYQDSVVAPVSHVGDNAVIDYTITLGSVPALQGTDERYSFQQNYCYIRYLSPTYQETQYWGTITPYVENGTLYAKLSLTYPWVGYFSARVYYSFDYYKIAIIPTGEWVWIYQIYPWQETYNLWDSASIHLSQFTSVGSPTNQVNTIKFIATGDYYLDNPYFIKANPIPQYVEAENTDSMLRGVKFQERKTDGWSSKESALAFATALVDIFGDPPESYAKEVSIKTDINIGDLIMCDNNILPVYRIYYDFNAGYKKIFVGRNITNTLEFLKETSRKIEALEKIIF